MPTSVRMWLVTFPKPNRKMNNYQQIFTITKNKFYIILMGLKQNISISETSSQIFTVSLKKFKTLNSNKATDLVLPYFKTKIPNMTIYISNDNTTNEPATSSCILLTVYKRM